MPAQNRLGLHELQLRVDIDNIGRLAEELLSLRSRKRYVPHVSVGSRLTGNPDLDPAVLAVKPVNPRSPTTLDAAKNWLGTG